MRDMVSEIELLAKQLHVIMVMDQIDPPDYDERNLATWKALGLAASLGYEVGFATDSKWPDWPVAMIQLPTGQVSWHTPAFPDAWDGHTDDVKYRRVVEYLAFAEEMELEESYVGKHRPETVVPV